MFEQTFKNIDDKLWKDAGCSSELDYVEQTSWILFLKYLDDLEKDRKDAAELSGKSYSPIITGDFRWEKWATPKDKEGKLDHHKAMTGDDLIDFVNVKLFPYLKKFKTTADHADTIEYKIGEIFSELKNRIQSGYNLREVINLVDELRFRSSKEKHEMSALYEDKIKNMGNAGRNGGEYYTPRPLIKTIVKVVNPKIGETIYDGAVGSAGFLCESFEYLKAKKNLTTNDIDTLQKKTFYGKEKKSLAYIIGIMNMILHGIEAPNILHTNTLAENLSDIQERDRYNVVLANPPFGGKERAEVQQNFPIKTGETAFLFLQHFIKILKAGGRAGVVITDTFLSNPDNASISLRKFLLDNCNLHTILDLPRGTFVGAGLKTVVLFFEKGKPTKNIWYYQLNLDRNLGKTAPLNENDLMDFVHSQKTKALSENSWVVNLADVDKITYDLSVKNPSRKNETTFRNPQDILDDIKALDSEGSEILRSPIFSFTNDVRKYSKHQWQEMKLGEVLKLEYGKPLPDSKRKSNGLYPVYGANGEKDRTDEFYYDKSSIIVGRKGSAFVTFEAEKHDLKFIYYLLQSLELPKLAKGVKPGINRNEVYSIPVLIPPLAEQRAIVGRLEALSAETGRLEEIYQSKVEALEELKKSVLQKAFAGEL